MRCENNRNDASASRKKENSLKYPQVHKPMCFGNLYPGRNRLPDRVAAKKKKKKKTKINTLMKE